MKEVWFRILGLGSRGKRALGKALHGRKRHGTARIVAKWIALVSIFAVHSAKAETLTEAEIVRLVRASGPAVVKARAEAAAAKAAEVRRGLYPNPSLAWERENLSAGDPATEDSLFLSVPVSLGGRRSAERALARAATSSAHARGSRVESDAVVSALTAFYVALAAEREVAILTRAAERLREAVRVVGQRHVEGVTSGYERTRLELELELADSALREADSRARIKRSTLALALGVEPEQVLLRGDLVTRPEGEAREPAARTSLRHLQNAGQEAELAARRAGWAWVPELALSGGVRFGETTAMRYGYVVGVTLELPIFSRGQELAAESAAEKTLAVAEHRALERETRVETVRAQEELALARAELERFLKGTHDKVALLERALLSGYREGERSVVELVDAEHARTHVDQRRLELELKAKVAHVELRAARGEFE